MRQLLITSLLREVSELAPDVNLTELEQRFTIILSSYHVERTGTEVVVWEPFPRAAQDYLTTRAIEGLSKNTLRTYHRVLHMFFDDVHIPVTDIDATTIKVWLYRKREQGVTDRTLAGYRVILNGFFRYCSANDIIGKNPVDKINPIRYEAPQHHAMNTDEMMATREACRDLRERAIVELLYSTGCRVSEFVAIKCSDIDLASNIVHAHNFKSRKEKTVYISERCSWYLRRYMSTIPAGSDVLFASKRRAGEGITVSGVEHMLRDIGRRAGLPNGRLHPHILRHTLATDIVTNGGSLADAQRILDHRKPETTMIYAEMSREQLKETHRRCAA